MKINQSYALIVLLSVVPVSIIIVAFDYGQSGCKSRKLFDQTSTWFRTHKGALVEKTTDCSCEAPPTTSTYNIQYIKRTSRRNTSLEESSVDRKTCDTIGARPHTTKTTDSVASSTTDCYITGNAFGIHHLEDVPNCNVADCVRVDRAGCSADDDDKLRIFDYSSLPSFPSRFEAYPEYSKGWMLEAKAAAQELNVVTFVDNPNDACIFWVWVPPVSGDITDLEYWNNGINHVLFLPNYWRPGNPDLPGMETTTHFSPGFSMLVLPTLIPEVYRAGYDLQIIRPPPSLGGWYLPSGDLNESKFQRNQRKAVHHERDVFFFFKGKINPGPCPGYAHRYLISCIHDERFVVDLQCRPNTCHQSSSYLQHHRELYIGNTDYDDSLRRAQFAYAAGGNGMWSFRMFEVLASGAIPVVVAGMALPYDDISDTAHGERASHLWQRCAVVVDPEDIVRRLPAILTAVEQSGRLDSMHKACDALFDEYFSDSRKRFYLRPLQLIRDRIKYHMVHQRERTKRF